MKIYHFKKGVENMEPLIIWENTDTGDDIAAEADLTEGVDDGKN